jgi:hypothetical protein
MNEMPLVKTSTTPYINLELHDADEAGNDVVVTYKLCFDYNALARIENELNVDLKVLQNWKTLSSGKFATLVWCGLARYHKDVTLEEVRNKLNPADERALCDPIFDMMFPGLMKALKEAQEEAARTGKDPNAQEPAAEQATA